MSHNRPRFEYKPDYSSTMPASTRSAADVQDSKTPANKLGGSTPTSAGKYGKDFQTFNPFSEGFDPAKWIPDEWKTLFYDCTTKKEFRAILREFLMLAFWRVRYYETPVIEKMLQFLQPRRQGTINSIDEVAACKYMILELQSEIIFAAHEVCARFWLETQTGVEFQATMQRLKPQKCEIPVVTFETIEGVLQLTRTELMSLWSPFLSAAILDYWNERNICVGRAIYPCIRNETYELIGCCIGLLQGENKAELDISHWARQWALGEVRSQKNLTYWPERDKPLPSTRSGWMALPQHFESAEDDADFKGLMARFNFRLDRGIAEDNGYEKGGGHIAEKGCVQRMNEGGASGEQSMTTEVKESGVEHCVSSNIVKRKSDDDNNHESHSSNSADSGESSSEYYDDEETRILGRYGGFPGVPSTSSRMDVAAMAKVEEDMVRHVEKIDRDARERETTFREWIHMREVQVHESDADMRYSVMGAVGRSAYDLAELQALNNIYEDVIVEMRKRIKRNQEMMKQIEELRLQCMENDRLYAEALAQYRQSSRELADARRAEQKAKDKDSGLSGLFSWSKKRKQPGTPETLRSGRKSEKTAKKLRNNT